MQLQKGRAPMKKSTRLIVLLSFAAALCFVLAGCAAGPKTTDFVWYKAAIPENYEPDTYFGDNCYDVRFENKADASFIVVDWSRLGVDEVIANCEEEGSQDVGEQKIGNYTWKVHTYVNSDGSTTTRYFMANEDGSSSVVRTYKLAPDAQPGKTFLESLEFADNPTEKYNEAKETPVPEIQR